MIPRFDLFFRIGNGAIDNTQLKAFVSQRNNRFMSFFKRGLKRPPSHKEVIDEEEVTEKFDSLVFGNDDEKLEYKLAKCCNPIPGDKVFGFITINVCITSIAKFVQIKVFL